MTESADHAQPGSIDPPVRILWVDDEPGYLTSFVEKLEESLGIKVDLASTIDAGKEKIRTTFYSALIVDLFIDRDGIAPLIEFLTYLPECVPPEDDRRNHLDRIPIIICSNNSERSIAIRAIDHLPYRKVFPFPKWRTPEDLVELVKEVVQL